MNRPIRGFALLIAVVFMSVMLSLGLMLGAIAFKQQVLASDAAASQYAFYAADAALECALYADQQQDLFAYNPDLNAAARSMTCDSAAPLSTVTVSHTAALWVIRSELTLDAGKHCADVTIYKYSAPQAPDNIVTYLFSQGYDTACSIVQAGSARFVARGLYAKY